MPCSHEMTCPRRRYISAFPHYLVLQRCSSCWYGVQRGMEQSLSRQLMPRVTIGHILSYNLYINMPPISLSVDHAMLSRQAPLRSSLRRYFPDVRVAAQLGAADRGKRKCLV